MDRKLNQLKQDLIVFNEESGEEYNWREIAMIVADKNIKEYFYFIRLKYSTAIEYLIVKNKVLQRENKKIEDYGD